jgi:hypothetical protein
MGSVIVDPDQATYSSGQSVTLTALADAGYNFAGWSGGLSGTENPVTLTMDGDKTVSAIFEASSAVQYGLTVTVNGAGSVSLSPPGGIYDEGTVVTLTASAADGWGFDGWGGLVGVTDNPTTIIVTNDVAIDANFSQEPGVDPPVIEVWYGSSQKFGNLGTPQNWVNILGKVTASRGMNTLTYSLNNGPYRVLSIGPDTRRLANSGDFNVDIPLSDLSAGINQVVIKAIDDSGTQAIETVYFTFESGLVCPVNYSIDWSGVSDIQDVAQIVDGKWHIDSTELRTTEPGYDRLVNIGDITWSDYEVTVPIKVNAFTNGNWGSSVGVIMRWAGHTVWDDSQPSWGYTPLGAIGWYYTGGDFSGLQVLNGGTEPLNDTSGFTLEVGVWYVFKMRVVTTDSRGATFFLKAWQKDTEEPLGWQIVFNQSFPGLQQGSMLLVAHNTDASFGNVTITSLE